jgi:serine/threonine protein kinase
MITDDPLETRFDKNKPDDIDAEEAKVITALIRRILRYEPSERPTAAELIEHEWFMD